jgi:hypothetical protein
VGALLLLWLSALEATASSRSCQFTKNKGFGSVVAALGLQLVRSVLESRLSKAVLVCIKVLSYGRRRNATFLDTISRLEGEISHSYFESNWV